MTPTTTTATKMMAITTWPSLHRLPIRPYAVASHDNLDKTSKSLSITLATIVADFGDNFVTENGDCRRKVRLSVAEKCDSRRFLRQSYFSATVAVFGDIVGRA